MRQIIFFKYALVSTLLIFAIACDKEDPNPKGYTIPEKVQIEFKSKFPNANITDFERSRDYLYSSEVWDIDFVDEFGNKSSACFNPNGVWKITYTELNSIDDLSFWAKRTFMRLDCADEEIGNIYRTERDGVLGSLYTLFLTSNDNVLHNVYINDDGLLLDHPFWNSNEMNYIINFPHEHFDFINEKYEDAEIRAYLYDFSEHRYIVLHEKKLKYITFKWFAEEGFWKETRYELDKDTILPDNVIKYMEKIHPDFVYTNIYYVESDKGNSYLLGDRRWSGYIVSEDI